MAIAGNVSGSGTDDELPKVEFSLAPQRDLEERGVRKTNPIVSKHVVLQHQLRVLTGAADEEDRQRICVRRSHIVQDALCAFAKPSFHTSKMLKVTFIGEISVDDGGPRRELFSVLMRELFDKSGLFTGWPENAVPVHNVHALAENKFYITGKIVATSLVQGGPPPVCFSRAVADYIVFDEVRSSPDLQDIPDFEVRQNLEKMLTIVNVEELRSFTDEHLELRFECGYQKPTSSLQISDKEEILKTVWLHFVYFLPLAELQQLRKGLRETLQLEILMVQYPDDMHSFLATSIAFDVDGGDLLDWFVASYSERGSNKRKSEEAVYLMWSNYVMDCSDGDESGVSIGDILQFISGSRRLPAAGFPCIPSVHFTNEKILPKTSTCDVSITFPRSFDELP
ncbi:G2/M phase-specific E3 ubiquitin-protein ligase-like [Halichondria panicea]|uniref:G2/M phase-specific E3 ubiquitin-protein ligase-like n=1 Tax=Halichondria panicea TaxID=6063 RepID=UPI00312B43F5